LETDCFACWAVEGCGWCLDDPEAPMCISTNSSSSSSDGTTGPVAVTTGTTGTTEGGTSTTGTTGTTGQSFWAPWPKVSYNSACMNWAKEDCNTFVLNCSIHDNCMNCTGDPSGGCSWCQSSKQCLHDDSEDAEACGIWKQKTCRDACVDFSQSCADCVPHSLCGWCDDYCVEGNATSPTYTTCNVYAYSNCTVQPNCTVYSNCNNCTAQPTCSWCEDGEGGNTCILEHQKCRGEIMKTCVIPFECTASNCSSCLENTQCVWCPDTQICEIASGTTDCDTTCNVPVTTASTTVTPVLTGVGTTGDSGLSTKMQGAIAGIVSAGFVVLAGFGFGVWYKYYWTKRHYYERLG